MRPSRTMAYAVACLFYITTLVQAAEVRKLGSNDLEWATPNQGAATTTVSPGGKTVTKIDAAQVPFRSVNGYVDNLIDGSYSLTPKVNDLITGGPWVDVRKFGAVAAYPWGASTASYADQTAAFQAAIDNVYAYGGGIVLVRTYNNLNWLVKGTLYLKPGVIVYRPGRTPVIIEYTDGQKGVIVHAPVDNTADLFVLNANDNSVNSVGAGVVNLTLYSASTGGIGTGTRASRYALNLWRAEDYHASNLQIRGFTRSINNLGSIRSSFNYIWSRDALETCFQNNYTGATGEQVTTTTDFYKLYCGYSQYGPRLDGAYGVNFYSPTVESNLYAGFDIWQKYNKVGIGSIYSENLPMTDAGYGVVQIGVNGTPVASEPEGFGSEVILFGQGRMNGPGATTTQTFAIIADNTFFSSVSGVTIYGFTAPLKTTANMKRLAWFGNSTYSMNLSGRTPTDNIYSMKALYGNTDFSQNSASMPVAQLGAGKISIYPAGDTPWFWQTRSWASATDLSLYDSSDGKVDINVSPDGGDVGLRGLLTLPALKSGNGTGATPSRSPSSAQWFGTDNTIFATGGTFEYIGTGGFSVQKRASDSKWYLVIVDDVATGVRKMVQIDNTVAP